MVVHKLKTLKQLGVIGALISTLFMVGCATESHQTLTPQTVSTYQQPYSGVKQVLAVGNFNNRSNYMQGIFTSGQDMLGSQAKSIVKTQLQQSGRFTVVDRDNMEEIANEAQISGSQQQLTGARYVLSGAVTEFGRRNIGDQQLFGILGKGKEQIAYANVAFNVIDVTTSQIVYSSQGAGEYSLSNREVIGFGGTAGYDATLNGKVLTLAITQAVEQMVKDLNAGVWEIR